MKKDNKKLVLKDVLNKVLNWIPVTEVLPEDIVRLTQYGNYQYTQEVLIKTKYGHIEIGKRSKFLNDRWKWKGSKRLNDSVKAWRLIEVKDYTIQKDVFKEVDKLINRL